MNTSIAIHAFEPASGDAALAMARTLVASRMLPKTVTTAEAAFAIIVTGRELGLTAMQSLRGIHIIEGKTVLASDTMLALVLRDPRCERFTLVESTASIATYEAKRVGAPPVCMSFTMVQAVTAGLAGKDNWKKFPDAMLRARCIAALARAVFADIFLGVYEIDEMARVEPPATVTVTMATPGTLAPNLAAAIAAAETYGALADVGRDISARKAALTPAELRGLQAAYIARRAALTAVDGEVAT
jgi:hypothetical protein